MKRLLKLLCLGAVVLSIACSGDTGKGDKFMAENKPDLALRYYKKALTAKKDDPALTMKVMKANILIAKQAVPQEQIDRAKFCLDDVKSKLKAETPAEVKKDYADAVALFAVALKNMKNVKDAMNALEEAAKIDPSNETVKKVLNESKVEYSGVLLSRAQDALKTMEFSVAEWNCEKALEYNPGLKEAEAFLKTVRKEGLPVYDKNKNICIAVSDVKQQQYKVMLLVFIVNNYDDDWFTVTPENFILVDKAGKEYRHDPKLYGKVVNRMGTKDLKPGAKINEATGALVFGLSASAGIKKLVFDDGKGHKVEKYFP
jgi:tetratricopeptide (TPR) repeat protein